MVVEHGPCCLRLQKPFDRTQTPRHLNPIEWVDPTRIELCLAVNSSLRRPRAAHSPTLTPRSWASRYEQFSDVFSKPIGLSPSRPLKHRIPLSPEATPINVKLYRYQYFQKAKIERLVSEMISEGVIRPSTSPYSVPVLLVKKSNGSWRFCVDYHVLNAVTVKEHFPIPTAEELFDEVAGARVFSKLDLRAGFHQVGTHTPDIEKTAFRTQEATTSSR